MFEYEGVLFRKYRRKAMPYPRLAAKSFRRHDNVNLYHSASANET